MQVYKNIHTGQKIVAMEFTNDNEAIFRTILHNMAFSHLKLPGTGYGIIEVYQYNPQRGSVTIGMTEESSFDLTPGDYVRLVSGSGLVKIRKDEFEETYMISEAPKLDI